MDQPALSKTWVDPETWALYYFSRTSTTNTQTDGLNNRNLHSPSSEGHVSEIKSDMLVPSKAVRGNLLHASLLASGGLKAVLGVP